jgi:hypothetical protein
VLSVAKYILVLLLSILFVYLGYFSSTTDLVMLPILFVVSFIIYFYLIFFTQDKNEVNALLWFSVLFRLIFLFAIPILSTDYIRHIFDGQLLLNGFNPYLFTPAKILSGNTPIPANLFNDFYTELSNNQTYSKTFPLVHILSLLSAVFTNINPLISIVILRIPIIIADFVLLKFLIKLLDKLNLSYSGLLIYALNPLVIIGLTGNINFIGVMLCFFVVGLYYIIHNKWLNSIFFFTLSATSSFFPFLLIPLVFKKLQSAKSMVLVFSMLVIFSLFWIPFYHPNFLDTIISNVNNNLFSFSTNFGLQQVIDSFTGEAKIITPILFGVALISISISRASDWISILKGMMFCVTAFMLLNFTIEPYYFVLLVFFSALVHQYHYAIIWSLFALINYPIFAPFLATHLWIMPVEYAVLLMLFLLELFGRLKSLSE